MGRASTDMTKRTRPKDETAREGFHISQEKIRQDSDRTFSSSEHRGAANADRNGPGSGLNQSVEVMARRSGGATCYTLGDKTRDGGRGLRLSGSGALCQER